MHELNEEKIDIIDWSPDPARFVGQALSPAKVTSVTVVDENLRAARVVVPDYQLSLAIGREGQNARLAARLTGWRIDIRSDTAARSRRAPPVTRSASFRTNGREEAGSSARLSAFRTGRANGRASQRGRSAPATRVEASANAPGAAFEQNVADPDQNLFRRAVEVGFGR